MHFLHELKEFPDLLKVIAAQEGIPVPMAEKDYWIMQCLWGLQEQGFDFYLKGGTSLSKGYGIIHRFSEDIDILIVPPKNMNVKVSQNNMKTAHIKSRKNYFDWLVSSIEIDGILKVEYDPSVEQDIKAKNADILLHYKKQSETTLEKLKDEILLEVGFDNVEPCSEKNISSWAIKYGIEAGLVFKDTQALKVKCYNPEYTFVEKLQAVSTKFRQHQETGKMARNFLRHYYDLYQLLDLPQVETFIGTDHYFSHKKKRFRFKDEQDLTKNEAFIMRDQKIREFYIEKYTEGKDLYYRGQPAFEDILNKLSLILSKG